MLQDVAEKAMALVSPLNAPPGASWLPRDGEPADAYDAFFFYRAALPSERSPHVAWRHMLAVRDPQRLASLKDKSAPKEWKAWEILYDWESRAADYDEAFRRELIGVEEDVLEEMVERHQEQLVNLQSMGMAYLEQEGFDTAAAALRAVHHSMDREQKMAGIPDVSEVLVMDSEALKQRFSDLLDLLARVKD